MAPGGRGGHLAVRVQPCPVLQAAICTQACVTTLMWTVPRESWCCHSKGAQVLCALLAAKQHQQSLGAA